MQSSGWKLITDLEKERDEISSSIIPSSKNERWAWVLYDFAQSAFEFIAMDLVFPAFLNFLAFQGGSTYSNSGDSNRLPNFSKMKQDWFIPGSCNISEINCVIPWWNGYIRPTTFALNVLSFSVVFNVFLLFSLNAVVDHSTHRNKIFYLFSLMGSLTLCLSVIPDPSNHNSYKISAVYIVLSLIFQGVSNSIYNSYLSVLSAADPHLIARAEKERAFQTINGRDVLDRLYEKATMSLSSHGSSAAFISGVITSITAAFILKYVDAPFSYKGALLFAGTWWLIFTIPAILFFQNRPGILLPSGSNYFTYSWKAMFKAIGSASRIPRTFYFLFAYFLYNDGITTMVYTRVFLYQNELKFSKNISSVVLVLNPLSSFAGSLLFPYAGKQFLIRPKTMLIILLCIYTVLSAYGILGLIDTPFGLRSNNVIALKNCAPVMDGNKLVQTGGSQCIYFPYELFAYTIIGRMLAGSIRTYSRTIFSQLVPKEQRYIFFGLYELSSKGNAFMGPLIAGLLHNRFGSIRYAFIYIAIVLMIPVPFLYRLDVIKGKEEADRYSKTIERKIQMKSYPHLETQIILKEIEFSASSVVQKTGQDDEIIP